MKDWLVSLTNAIHWDAWSTIIQATIAAAALIFFAWKLRTGWLIINLSVAIELKRQRHDETHDDLALTIILQKGSIDTVWLRYIEYRVRELRPSEGGAMLPVSPDHALVKPTRVADLGRWLLEDGVLRWDKIAEGYDLTLSPNETAHFAASARIRKGVTYLVEAIVVGYRPHWEDPGFQWRASTVTLPVQTPNDVASNLAQESQHV